MSGKHENSREVALAGFGTGKVAGLGEVARNLDELLVVANTKEVLEQTAKNGGVIRGLIDTLEVGVSSEIGITEAVTVELAKSKQQIGSTSGIAGQRD